ncbi:hypothetical protein Agub_g11344, partial [Astrephomene gubernaculifera]
MGDSWHGAESAPVLDVTAYRIIRTIGKGGFAKVFSVAYTSQSGGEDIMALKLPRPLHADNPKSRDLLERLFLTEAQLTASVKHKNIVRCHGLRRVLPGFPGLDPLPEPSWGMLLEYCEGGSLSDRLLHAMARGRACAASELTTLGWLADVAEALTFLH